ncbi:regulatory protein SipA [Chamaesiphon sp. VAR_69_metabat_338]|uniref:regulatory protein SipA n=1 Tax=Chamaesiphon sp. VAR_69_metabat_338 TaxID=2964704 RepID=UPI00286DA4A0|nr:DUF3148 domain-containing protein [Chamaesiphon sp. VAR_69_metabat_338]
MSQELNIGATVRLILLPAYLKTADPMPMLRPSSLLEVGAEGIITDRRPGNYWAVKFDRSSFLLEARYLAVVSS